MRAKWNSARVLAISGGKGGVGKTSLSVNLAIALAAEEMRTAILDADLGLANVEVLLGLNSLYNLQQVVTGEKHILDILVEGPGGIYVVPGSSGISKIADLGSKARQNVLNGLEELQGSHDFVIIDTMAGIGQNAVSFAAAADEVLIVTTPEPSSIVDAYAMIKTIYQTRSDAVIHIVVNMALNEQQGQAVAAKLREVAGQYLGQKPAYLGCVPRDPHVSRSVMQTYPFLLKFPTAPASRSVEALALRLIHQRAAAPATRSTSFFRRFAENLGLVSNG